MTRARLLHRLVPGSIALACLAFFAISMAFVPSLGIEADEALVANGIYPRVAAWYSWKLAGYEIPIMLLTYLGALKAWLCNGLFLLWPPSGTVLRVPMVLAGCATIWLFFLLLKNIAGWRAAWAGALLLATDVSFLLTEAVDLGFVALQHLFKLGALLFLLRFHQTGSRRALSSAFLLLGLGLWDKAVFVWVLAALGIATLVVFPRELRKHVSPRNLGHAALWFSIGAFPFLVYNVARPLETFRANSTFDTAGLYEKTWILHRTVDGSVLFGFLVAVEPGPLPGVPQNGWQNLSTRLARAAPRISNLVEPALLVSILLLPLLWKTPARRPILFALVTIAVMWVQMAFTSHAGAAAHHVILLWPFQLMIIAVAAGEISRHARIGAALSAAAVAVLVVTNLLLINEYYFALLRNGTAWRCTDAIQPLTETLSKLRAPKVFIIDWGMGETIHLLSQGSVPIEFGSDALTAPVRTPADLAALRYMLGTQGAVFVSHTADLEVLRGVRARLDEFARTQGLQRELLHTIRDRNGRAVFEVFRYRTARVEAKALSLVPVSTGCSEECFHIPGATAKQGKRPKPCTTMHASTRGVPFREPFASLTPFPSSRRFAGQTAKPLLWHLGYPTAIAWPSPPMRYNSCFQIRL